MNYIITNRKKYFDRIDKYYFNSFEEFQKDIKDKEKLAYDSETTGLSFLKNKIFAIQIGTGVNNYLFDIEGLDFPIELIFEKIKDKTLILHNALFDLTFMYKHNFFPKKVKCTFLASKILNNGLIHIRHDFGTVMSTYLNIKYDKTEQENINKIKLSTKESIQYCFNDVDKLIELEKVLEQRLIKVGSEESYYLHNKWIRACAYMECCGVPINKNKWKLKIKRDKEEQIHIKKTVEDYIINNLPKFCDKQLDLFSSEPKLNISINSPLQMINVFEELGINIMDDTKKTGKSISNDIINKSDHPFVKLWQDYTSITHDVTTFGENFLPSIFEGRLYTKYKPILNTARISAGGKNKDKYEIDNVNTLNIPSNQKSREPFEANPGFKYLVADYDGQENICVADLTGDKVMIDSIINDLCLHCAFARLIFPEIKHLSDDEIKKFHKDKRQFAKAPRFAINFGGSAYTLHTKENIPIKEAIHIEKMYKELHPSIIKFGNDTLEKAVETGYIEYALGFKLYLPYFEEFKKLHIWIKSLNKTWWDKYKIGKLEYKKQKEAIEQGKEYFIKDKISFELYKYNASSISKYFQKKGEYLRLCLNAPSQGTAAHITKAATNAIYEYIMENNHFWKARISLVVHDELNMEVVDELASEYQKVIEKCMIEEGNKFLKRGVVSLSTKCNIGNNWYEAK